MYNYKMTISYDGSRYDGWQRRGRDDNSNSVEFKIIEVLKKLTSEEIVISAACRTEKGVHAIAQVANFKTNAQLKPVDIQNYLTRYLPRDIVVSEVTDAPERFDASLNVKAETYVYKLDIGAVPNVFTRKHCYHTFKKPDFDAMREAAALLTGEHDFKNYTSAKKSKSTVKNVEIISIFENGDTAEIEITANGFMHNMARMIIGRLLDVGSGLSKPESVKQVLEGTKDIPSMPAESCGLFLKSVRF